MATNEFNQAIIKEFRENKGIVGGMFEGAPMILVTTEGSQSGTPRTVPLVYLADGYRYVIFASAAGSDQHPSWFHNISKNPRVIIEVGSDKHEATARITEEPERSELFAKQVAVNPGFAEYQEKTSRVIPVIALTVVEGD